MAAEDFIIVKKRKKYKFAKFAEFANCYEFEEYLQQSSKFLQKNNHVVIELGAGTAELSLMLAQQNPSNLYVAIDVKADRLFVGANKAIEQNIGNIIFVRAHADKLVEIFPPGSVQEIWLTFPDPFPKKRHIKHRMTHLKFLKNYRKILGRSGIFHFKTDNHAMFDWSLAQLVAAGAQLKNLTFDLHASDLPEEYKIMTRYERRFVAEGLPVHLVDARWT
jgi:tRNA (guanine-N7-)-methyltransferase